MAEAHGEEILAVFIPAVMAGVLFVMLLFVRFPVITRVILSITYFITFTAMFFFADKLPFEDSDAAIWVILVFPVLTTIALYYVFKAKGLGRAQKHTK